MGSFLVGLKHSRLQAGLALSQMWIKQTWIEHSSIIEMLVSSLFSIHSFNSNYRNWSYLAISEFRQILATRIWQGRMPATAELIVIKLSSGYDELTMRSHKENSRLRVDYPTFRCWSSYGRFGSLAALHGNITWTAASGRIPDDRWQDLWSYLLNVRFSQ